MEFFDGTTGAVERESEPIVFVNKALHNHDS